ncbi:MAG TPA: L-histidine N(alpha)-methyltransferase, partial [Terriglobia bacterium]|nr:L-histidine N(alpha)-methyltransferase [Terriglobia bacterium]
MLVRGGATYAVSTFAEEVREGLGCAGQKTLPSKYLYDEVGSALFEVITKLPEYGLTRAEERILRRHSDEIAERLGAPGMVVELGSGSGRKTRRILEALARHRSMTYCPIEISSTALVSCERELDD